MSVDSLYVHALEGRLRIKIPAVKGAAGQAKEVERHLGQFAGVEHVSANPITGNALILYNPHVVGQDDILASLREPGYLSQPGPRPGVVEKVTATVAASLVEAALARLVSALI
jgi:copper chaperone CopZ